MHVSVMGAGYVGLVAGACLADAGHRVVCVDADRGKVEALLAGRTPIHEPGLEQLIARNSREGRLTFTAGMHEGLAGSEVVFCAVGTPSLPSGGARLDAVFEVARGVIEHGRSVKLLVLKSTVPVGTNERVAAMLREAGCLVEVASNPEFLREGSAIADFREPDRVVVGVRSAEAVSLLREIYQPFVDEGSLLVMSPVSAEMTKYAANAMLATRISFMNAIARVCERVGADIAQVGEGVGRDRRIGPHFLSAGIGYGGSCFPKDVQALLSTAREQGEPLHLLEEVHRLNERQKRSLVQRMQQAFSDDGGLEGRTVALWGLSFKPHTDDVREAPSLAIIEELLECGARIRAHDPVAGPRVRERFASACASNRLLLRDSPCDAAHRSEALVIATDWPEYRTVDLAYLRGCMSRPWIFDGRNLWAPAVMGRAGFRYSSVGRPEVLPASRQV